jgi:hypothetical protein
MQSGVFGNVNPKLVALDALFLCHLWSLHARALRSIVQNIDQFFDIQCEMLLNGMRNRSTSASPARKRPGRTVLSATR